MGVLAPGPAHARLSAWPPLAGPEISQLQGTLIFLLLRTPCNVSEPYNNPFWGFEQRYWSNLVNCWLSLLIWRLNLVILQVESGYMAVESGYIASWVYLYGGWIWLSFATKIVAYLSCSVDLTHFNLTNLNTIAHFLSKLSLIVTWW
jgi:hypothetical protein